MIRLRVKIIRIVLGSWLALVAGSSVAAQSAAASWQFQKNADPMGSGYVAVALADAGTVRPMVRCWTEAASLDVRFTLAPDQPLPSVDRVLVGFDGKQPVAANWNRNANRLALLVPAQLQRTLLANMRRGNEMRLTLVAEDGDQHTHVIALNGSARAIDQVLSGCKGR